MAELTLANGKYRIIRELGRGSFGTVYEAEDTSLKVRRAIKVLHPMMASDPSFIERFRREAQVAASLEDHPNIARVYGLEQDSERVYFVMRLMPGGSLADRLKSGPLSFDEALKVTEQIASALDYSHQHGVIHRDVKPNNILFDEHGAAYLTDFGFVKAQLESGLSSSSGGMVGTPSYIAPEIWQGNAATPASDEYALACAVYEMLTGDVLFSGNSAPEIMTKHVLKGAALPETWPSGIPGAISPVLRKALAKEPGERFASAGKMSQALNSANTPPTAGVVYSERMDSKATSGSHKRNTPAITLRWLFLAGVIVASVVILLLIFKPMSVGPANTPTAIAAITSTATILPIVLKDTDTLWPSPTNSATPSPTYTLTPSSTPSPTFTFTATTTSTSTKTKTTTPTGLVSNASSSTPTPTKSRTPTPAPPLPPNGALEYTALLRGSDRQPVTNGTILFRDSVAYFTVKNVSGQDVIISHRGLAVRPIDPPGNDGFIDGRGLQWPGYEGQLGSGQSVEIEVRLANLLCSSCEVFPSLSISPRDKSTQQLMPETWIPSPAHYQVAVQASAPEPRITNVSIRSESSRSLTVDVGYASADISGYFVLSAWIPDYCPSNTQCQEYPQYGYADGYPLQASVSFKPTATSGATSLTFTIDNVFCKAGTFSTSHVAIAIKDTSKVYSVSSYPLIHNWCSSQ